MAARMRDSCDGPLLPLRSKGSRDILIDLHLDFVTVNACQAHA